ncbi:MAG TPA: fused MFS/spermidine synthase [Opitutaceae bacterium]|nr:fused MFS/spermidine synthase [Opitutaceae bacterium]HND61427.1 fused MFS/spermidine synthase [Opitutaceae bacterium]
MNEPRRSSSPVMDQVLSALVIGAVPLAAFLSFVIQPLMGKRLLPIYGGTAATWLGCMVYFQVALLLGYSWAAWLVRRPFRQQFLATTILALVAVVTFQLPSDQADATASILRVVWRLSYTTLPAMLLLFSTSPLLHGWLRRRGEDVPYYLYAISNTGSLAAVLLYPFAFEPNLRLSEQTTIWHVLLVVVAGLLVGAGYLLRRLTGDAAGPAATAAAEPLEFGRTTLWLWLSALTCVSMLGATYHLAAELGSTPLAWVGPFSAYLLSFMVAFSGRWRPWMTGTTIVWLAISLTGFMLAKGFTAATVNATAAWWLLSLTASGCFLGNALLHSTRPAERFERYYLVLAAGGVLGGLVSSTIVPYLLARPIEFELASVALLTTGLLWQTGRRDPATVVVTGLVVLVPVLGLGLQQAGSEVPATAKMVHTRDLYGHIMVRTDARSVVLSSDTTTHGSQLISDVAARRRPTLYYSESTGVGRTLEKFQATRPAMRVGVVGLGAGTLAAYSRPGDIYDFWDIDPKILQVARTRFTYVADAAGRINLVERDGRRALESTTADYDVIVIDAFTGDGVPPHLLTTEALNHYFQRLKARHGVLLIHASTRYSRLFPVLAATARSINKGALLVATDITESLTARDWDPTHTEYIILAAPDQMEEITGWFPTEEEKGRVKRLITVADTPLIDQQLIWTDDRNAALDTLDVGRFLFQP